MTATPADPPPVMTERAVRDWIVANVPVDDYAEKSVLFVVPDATRTAPLPLLFDALHGHLAGVAERIDVIVALGTHQPMPDDAIADMLGISSAERSGKYADVGLFNHEWDNADALSVIGTLSPDVTRELSEGRLDLEVPVAINKRIHDYDRLLVVG
ncbi:MAG: lactate racemase domain-containing protein, partial [Planctomycetota bacterium]